MTRRASQSMTSSFQALSRHLELSPPPPHLIPSTSKPAPPLFHLLYNNNNFMRFNSTTLLRTLYAVSNVTTRYLPQQHSAALQPLINKAASGLSRHQSMPIPFLSSLFSSAPSRNMSYPMQKSKDEWQAILSPGKSISTTRQC